MVKFQAMKFDLKATDGCARAGVIETSNSIIETPAFMPCATIGAVRAVRWQELENLDYRLILMNALHLYLRPGTDVIRNLGGVHEFTSWNRSILADSGGYQFFSLKGLFKINDDGVTFQSPYDGSTHQFSPEKVIDIQSAIGSDIVMPLDECAPGDSTREKFKTAGERTVSWLGRAKEHFRKCGQEHQSLFGIIQGGTDRELRKLFTEMSGELDLDGYAIGGVSVGEDRELGEDIVDYTASLMPQNKPRYLMGVGLPDQLLHGISAGIDMFDCVLPTRMARNGTLFTSNGRLNIGNNKFISEDGPLDSACSCATCKNYSTAYLAHLHRTGDPGVLGLLSIHNLAYYRSLIKSARDAILSGNFESWKNDVVKKWKAEVES